MKQNPGMVRGLDLSSCGVRESEILKNLADSWFVTRLECKDVGKDKFYSLFLKPTDELKNKFHFFGDVLCVLHPHSILDGRVFEYIERNLSSNRYRLDKLCVLLISNASSIAEQVARNSVEEEARVVVPFTYQEFSGTRRGNPELIIKRLSEHLYTKNLFGISSALKTDRYFFGRKAVIQKLIGKYKSGENASIFGLRRIGKTSVLWAIVRELKTDDVPVILIDCSDTRYHQNSWNVALYHVKNSLFGANNHGKQGHKQSDYTPERASISFQEDIQLIRKNFKKPILFIFDEIESLSFDLSPSSSWSGGEDYLCFWQTIRANFQQNTNLFTFQICGVNPYILENPILPDRRDNPLYRYIEPDYLGFFEVGDVTDMVSMIGGYMGCDFDREVYTYLTDDYGGHPFLIRQVCSRIYEQMSVKDVPRRLPITKEYYKNNRLDLTKSLSDYVDSILKVLTERFPREYALLQLLAAKDFQKFNSFDDSPHLIEHLIGYGLILKSEGKYHFRINVVEESVERKSTHLKQPTTKEEMWSLMSKERNALEADLREIVRQTLKVSNGPIDAKLKMIEAMNKSSQKTKAKGLKYDDIFKGEIYFNDLKNVIDLNWSQFLYIFDKDLENFRRSMTVANKYRIDAHAKKIVDSQFREAMRAISWLKDALERNT